LGEANMTY